MGQNGTAQRIIKRISSLWNSSKYFRIVSIAFGSLTFSYFANRIYLNLYRKYFNLPPGIYGIPFLGQLLDFADPFSFCSLAPNKNAVSITMGPSFHVVAINDPYLIKQIYSDSRTVDNPAFFDGK